MTLLDEINSMADGLDEENSMNIASLDALGFIEMLSCLDAMTAYAYNVGEWLEDDQKILGNEMISLFESTNKSLYGGKFNDQELDPDAVDDIPGQIFLALERDFESPIVELHQDALYQIPASFNELFSSIRSFAKTVESDYPEDTYLVEYTADVLEQAEAVAFPQ